MKPVAQSQAKHKCKECPLVSGSSTAPRFSVLWRQIFAAAGPIIASSAAGMTNGYSAILIPQLQKNESNIQITTEQSSWIASMATLPMAAGCIIGGLLMEKYGRKITHLILSICFAVGWTVLSIAGNYNIILVGRFITGLSCGLVGPPASVYIAETSDPKYRGFLLAAVTLAVSSGILLSHTFGTFFYWKTAALLCSLFMVLSYIFVSVAPESPSWLLSIGQVAEAEKSFRWLRGCDEASLNEFGNMVKEKQNLDRNMDNSLTKWQTFKKKISKPEFVKPLIIILVFFFTMQFSGVNIVAFYSISIMKDTMGSNINEYLAMLIIDVVRVATSFVACVLLRIIGRRPLAILSGSGTTVSLIGLSIFLYFQTSLSRYQNVSWMSLIFLISYIVFVGIGLFPLPWCMTGEIFPVESRGIGSGLSSSFNFICFFIVIKTGPSLFSTIGVNGTFLVYGSIALVGTLVLYFILPETRNKTLQEIENRFKNRVKKSESVPI